MKRDFLTLSDLSKDELNALMRRTKLLKEARNRRRLMHTLQGRTLVLIFEKASTRTRLSFEAAMAQLGGHCITLPPDASQMNRGEPLEDTARVTSRYSDVIMMRTFADARLRQFARAATVPVINGLTDGGAPGAAAGGSLHHRRAAGSDRRQDGRVHRRHREQHGPVVL